jgi:hypothetical protein
MKVVCCCRAGRFLIAPNLVTCGAPPDPWVHGKRGIWRWGTISHHSHTCTYVALEASARSGLSEGQHSRDLQSSLIAGARSASTDLRPTSTLEFLGV